jgi:uncharacterized protein YndB with AHSA1/START domain
MTYSKIRIEATISAELAKVWTCWIQPQHITQWNFASDDWCCPTARNDVKMGGTYCARMEAKDGSFGFDFAAVYDEVIEHKKLSYTLEDGRKVTTEFQKIADKTKVTTVFDAEKENSEDLQRDGWQAILNNFKKYAEAQ